MSGMSRSSYAWVAALAVIAAVSLVVIWQRMPVRVTYDITDLGDLPGGRNFSRAYDINDAGQVVGVSGGKGCGIGSLVPSFAGKFFWDPGRAFLWEHGSGMVDLGALPGWGNCSEAFAINRSGAIVGASTTSGGTHAVSWRTGTAVTDLGDLAGGLDRSAALDINDAGQVVGFGVDELGDHAVAWRRDGEAFKIRLLPRRGPTSEAFGINNAGVIVGLSKLHENTRNETYPVSATVWESGVSTSNLETRIGHHAYSEARKIDDAGDIVGTMHDSSAGGTVAFLWRPRDGLINLGHLRRREFFSVPHAEANDVNSIGQVVGASTSQGYPDTAAFIWDEANGMRDLNKMIDRGLGWTLVDATAINDEGQIVGYGERNGLERAFLLTPR